MRVIYYEVNNLACTYHLFHIKEHDVKCTLTFTQYNGLICDGQAYINYHMTRLLLKVSTQQLKLEEKK